MCNSIISIELLFTNLHFLALLSNLILHKSLYAWITSNDLVTNWIKLMDYRSHHHQPLSSSVIGVMNFTPSVTCMLLRADKWSVFLVVYILWVSVTPLIPITVCFWLIYDVVFWCGYKCIWLINCNASLRHLIICNILICLHLWWTTNWL